MPYPKSPLTPCACGGTEFRLYTSAPVAFQISDGELTLELLSVYRRDLPAFVINCEDCGASMDADGLNDEDGEPVDATVKPALDAALTELLEGLAQADVMVDLTR